MGSEYELKFRANPRIQQAVLEQYPGDTEQFSMETTYYDSSDGFLSRNRYTLRRRMENGRSVCTLKTPGKGLQWGEWEVEAPDIETGIQNLQKLGAPIKSDGILSSGLTATCGARFTRIARTLRLAGCTLELACDEGILTGGGRQEPLCEIEVELKEGAPRDADSFGRELAEKFGLEPEEKSKFCRAFALYKGESHV